MNTAEMIQKIKAIVNKCGSFSTGELDEPYSPVYTTHDKDSYGTVEKFGYEKVTVVYYIHEVEVNSIEVPYEDLSDELLQEVLQITEQYQKEMDDCIKHE
jgi:hypothetical protein